MEKLKQKAPIQEKKKLSEKIPLNDPFMKSALKQMKLHKALLDKLKDA